MNRPVLLDLFCGAGGCAMGYHRAGFEVVGIDNRPQPRYPFTFIQGDALNPSVDLSKFDAIHASPPCQAFTAGNQRWKDQRASHPDLLTPCREWLAVSGLPYVIENVPGAPLLEPVRVCGLAFGLKVRRHRLFESSVALFGTECRDHDLPYVIVYGGGVRGRTRAQGRAKGGGPALRRLSFSLEVGQIAMGIDWMTRDELSQAIPPAYTEWIGRQLMRHVA